MKISIVLPSYLGAYEGAATNRPAKLHRAVCSFLQCLPGGERELVIVSDGCDETDAYWQRLAKAYGSETDEARFNERTVLRHVRIERVGRFSGQTRNAGIEAATGDVVAYLDSDDCFRPDHLVMIERTFGDSDWVWFDDNLWPEQYRRCRLEYGRIGTSCIAHRKSVRSRWVDEYNHDWRFIQDLMAETDNYRYVGDGGYIVCHVPNGLDV